MVHFQDRVEQGIEQEGSNLSGVSSRCAWDEPGDNDYHSTYSDEDKENNRLSAERRGSQDSDRRQITDVGELVLTCIPQFKLLMLVRCVNMYFSVHITSIVEFCQHVSLHSGHWCWWVLLTGIAWFISLMLASCFLMCILQLRKEQLAVCCTSRLWYVCEIWILNRKLTEK